MEKNPHQPKRDEVIWPPLKGHRSYAGSKDKACEEVRRERDVALSGLSHAETCLSVALDEQIRLRAEVERLQASLILRDGDDLIIRNQAARIVALDRDLSRAVALLEQTLPAIDFYDCDKGLLAEVRAFLSEQNNEEPSGPVLDPRDGSPPGQSGGGSSSRLSRAVALLREVRSRDDGIIPWAVAARIDAFLSDTPSEDPMPDPMKRIVEAARRLRTVVDGDGPKSAVDYAMSELRTALREHDDAPTPQPNAVPQEKPAKTSDEVEIERLNDLVGTLTGRIRVLRENRDSAASDAIKFRSLYKDANVCLHRHRRDNKAMAETCTRLRAKIRAMQTAQHALLKALDLDLRNGQVNSL